MPETRETPGPLIALRTLVGVQVAVLAVGTALGLALAVLMFPSRADDGGEFGSWGGDLLRLGLSVAGTCAAVALLLVVPVCCARRDGGRPAVVAVGFLALVEAAAALACLVGIGHVVAGSGAEAAWFPTLLTAPSVAVPILALAPSTRRWAALAWRGRR